MYFLGLLFLASSILPSLARVITPRQDFQPMPLPAISFDETTWHFHLDKACTERAMQILKSPAKFKRSWDGDFAQVKRDDLDSQLQAAIASGVQQLFQSIPFVEQIYQLIAGSPIPGVFDHISQQPAWDNQDLEKVYVEVIPLAGAMAPAQVPDELLPWVTATILGLTYVYLTDPQNQLALKQSFDVPRRGIVGNSCPKKENNECGHRLCRGSDEVCTHKFLEGCACSNTCSIPADAKRWFVCNERACGGADKNGECNGDSTGANKGCFCVRFADGEPLHVIPGNTELEEFLNADPGKPDDPDPDDGNPECTKLTTPDLKDKPELWKFVDQQILDSNITTFCDEDLRGLDNAAGGNYERTYESGKLNEVLIGAEWESGATFTAAECKGALMKVSEGCDWSSAPLEENPNQYNWKWGGTIKVGKIKLRIEPQKNRVAITEQKGNSTHWAEIRQQNPEEDINKVRKGRNGKEWDMLVIHQCLHDLWRQDWNGAKRFDCAGLVEFSVAANNGYISWEDCITNIWETISWNIMHDGVIALMANHKGGAGPAGVRCWGGIESYDMPA